MSKIFFFNISIGATFIMTPWTTVTMSSLIPDVFGGNAGNQVLLDSLNSSFQTTVRNSVDLIRNQLFLIPSIQLAFGFLI
jgi:TRAP-type mannitol/chloroaromatic compound transport system permease small subunit